MKKIVKKLDKLMENIGSGKYTAREIVMMGAILFLTGTVFGMFCSPKKYQVMGSYNGNGSQKDEEDQNK